MKEISPLDGRYRNKLSELGSLFSEYALAESRAIVELEFLLFLDKKSVIELSSFEKESIEHLKSNFSQSDFSRIKEIESETRHDVKAIEIFLREKLDLGFSQAVHIGLTSEDINNIAYSRILKNFVEGFYLPELKELLTLLKEKASAWAVIPFPTRTHGQLATPSTLGKEIANHAYRLLRKYRSLNSFSFWAKINGATGNYSALSFCFPDIHWPSFSREFLESMGFHANLYTTQIEPHDSWVELFAMVKHTNKIIQDLDVDNWLYISHNLFFQKVAKGQVGSSTMPHKINPIRFENSEGNVEVANALLARFEERLPTSRMQRDLSDSTVQRNMGVALSHSLLALKELRGGLGTLEPNQKEMESLLDEHWELLAEPIQTALKLHGVPDAYEKLRVLSQGKNFNKESIWEFLESLDIPPSLKSKLQALTPRNYLGLAQELTAMVVATLQEELSK